MNILKRSLIILMAITFVFSLVACQTPQDEENTSAQSTEEITSTEMDSSMDNENETEAKTETKTEAETEIIYSFPPTLEELASMDFSKVNYVLATDQRQTEDQIGAVVLIDLDHASESLDDAVIWRYSRSENFFRCPSGIKFRENTIYGDVVLIACSGGYAGVISFPEGEELWSVDYCGNNPHSIEILPDGSIVTASSNGNEIRIYPPKSTKYLSVEVNDAHAVLWDKTNECLWALSGSGTLYAYKEIVTERGKYKLEEIKKYTLKGGAHECTQDFSDPDYLFVCVHEEVYRVNKNTGAYTVVTSAYCKGYGKNKKGNTIYIAEDPKGNVVWANDDYASWCCPVINVVYGDSGKQVKYRSEECAFYKSFVFDGDY